MSLSSEEGVKPRPTHIESSTNAATQVPTYHAEVDVSSIDEKKLLRKIDMRLIPWLSLLYLLSFLDRTSIGNAKVRGLLDSCGVQSLTEDIISARDSFTASRRISA